MRKKLAIGALTLSLLTGGGFGVNAALAGNGNGNGVGHTPVTVCHWVPAAPAGNHQIAGPAGVGGSYVVIVVDDDGANVNKNHKAHEHHVNDRFGDADCGVGGEEE